MAGDIADDLGIIDRTLRKLRSQFGAVFYVPSNHELWARGGEYDSVEKFWRVIRIAFDQVIEGIRYVHHAFDYPRGEGWSKEPSKQIWESVA